MCTMVLKEVITYYAAHGDSVYCSMLDATNAFDRVEYCKCLIVCLVAISYVCRLHSSAYEYVYGIMWLVCHGIASVTKLSLMKAYCGMALFLVPDRCFYTWCLRSLTYRAEVDLHISAAPRYGVSLYNIAFITKKILFVSKMLFILYAIYLSCFMSYTDILLSA